MLTIIMKKQYKITKMFVNSCFDNSFLLVFTKCNLQPIQELVCIQIKYATRHIKTALNKAGLARIASNSLQTDKPSSNCFIMPNFGSIWDLIIMDLQKNLFTRNSEFRGRFNLLLVVMRDSTCELVIL